MTNLDQAIEKYTATIEPAAGRALAAARAMSDEASTLRDHETTLRTNLAGPLHTARHHFMTSASYAELKALSDSALADLIRGSYRTADTSDVGAAQLSAIKADVASLLRTMRSRMNLAERRDAFDPEVRAAVELATNCREYLTNQGAAL